MKSMLSAIGKSHDKRWKQITKLNGYDVENYKVIDENDDAFVIKLYREEQERDVAQAVCEIIEKVALLIDVRTVILPFTGFCLLSLAHSWGSQLTPILC